MADAPMTMRPLQSSNLAAAGYDENTKTLRIKFNYDSRVHDYYGVPKETFDMLWQVASAGSYFARFIKDTYPSKRIE